MIKLSVFLLKKLMKNKKTILIVDDEKDIRELLEYNLNKNNYNTITAIDGLDALIKVNSKIDLILLDVMMPNLDGYQTCQKIRNNLTTKNIPIIFLTAKILLYCLFKFFISIVIY